MKLNWHHPNKNNNNSNKPVAEYFPTTTAVCLTLLCITCFQYMRPYETEEEVLPGRKPYGILNFPKGVRLADML